MRYEVIGDVLVIYIDAYVTANRTLVIEDN